MKNKQLAINICLLLFGIIIGYKYSNYRAKVQIEEAENSITMNDTGISIKDLKISVITKGDTIAYKNLKIEYLNTEYYKDEILFYSLMMANKYNYSQAYFDVYKSLTDIYEHDISVGSIDDKTKELALKYLYKGVELNEYDAICKLSELCFDGKYVSKDTILGNKLAKKAEKITPLLQK